MRYVTRTEFEGMKESLASAHEGLAKAYEDIAELWERLVKEPSLGQRLPRDLN